MTDCGILMTIMVDKAEKIDDRYSILNLFFMTVKIAFETSNLFIIFPNILQGLNNSTKGDKNVDSHCENDF